MKKHYSKLLLSLTLASVISVNVFGAVTFTDVNDKHWAYTGISYMQEQGYMTKNSSGEFKPSEEISYFDVAEILAKATGYQDELVVKDMDPTLKKQITDNYEKQKPVLKTYTDKFSTWETRCNEEIAYLLGRGYLSQDELSRFMIKTADGKEVKNILTKQDFVTMLVRVIGKEVSAKSSYTGKTNFQDNDLIREENRPYVAYYNQIGLLNGDTKGNMGANTKVTRALGAQMTYSALMYKEKLDKENPTTPTTPEVTGGITGTVSKVVPKNNGTGETYVLLEVNGKTTFYTANLTTKVTDSKGQALNLENVKVGEKVNITVAKENGVELIKTIQLLNSTGGSTPTTPDTDTKPTDGENQNSGESTSEQEATSYLGDVENIGRSGSISISTSQGTVTYLTGDTCEVLYDGQSLKLDELQIGDRVRIYVENYKIVKINVLSRAEAQATEAEFVKVTNKVTSYNMTLLEGTKEKTVEVDKEATIKRNGKRATIEDLRVGDKLTLTMEGKVVVGIEATSEESSFVGTVESIIISNTPQLIVRSKGELKTVNITTNTDLYDSTSKSDVSLREVLLGSKVEVLTESKEAVSVVVKEKSTEISYKGTVQYVGPSAKYIDVVVEYDALTGETMTLKRVNIPTQVKIIVDREVGYRNQIKEGMEVLMIYNYGEDMAPQSIEVIK